MGDTDIWIVVGVTLAATFGFLSFLNTLGMHLAVRVLKKKVVRILDRIENVMDDPTGTLVPHIEKMIQRVNDDKEFRAHIAGGITFAINTAKGAVLNKEPEIGPDGKPKPAKKGWIKTLMELAEVGAQLGIIKLPKG